MKWFLLLSLCLSANGAVVFDGVNDLILTNHLSNTDPFSSQAKLTASFWFKRYTTNSSILFWDSDDEANGSRNHFYYKFSFDNTKTNRGDFSYSDANTLAVNTFSTGPDVFSATNVWVHWAFTYNYNDASTATHYVNGVKVVGAWTSGAGGTGASSTAGSIAGGTTINNFFHGEMDDFAIWWETILTANQIATLGKSHQKIMPLMWAGVGSVSAGGFSAPKCGLFYPLNDLPDGSTISGNLHNLSAHNVGGNVYWHNYHTKGSPVMTAERVSSYPPNE